MGSRRYARSTTPLNMRAMTDFSHTCCLPSCATLKLDKNSWRRKLLCGGVTAGAHQSHERRERVSHHRPVAWQPGVRVAVGAPGPGLRK